MQSLPIPSQKVEEHQKEIRRKKINDQFMKMRMNKI